MSGGAWVRGPAGVAVGRMPPWAGRLRGPCRPAKPDRRGGVRSEVSIGIGLNALCPLYSTVPQFPRTGSRRGVTMPERDRYHDQVENASGDRPAVAPAADPRSWTAETVGAAAGWTHPLPDALIARLRSIAEARGRGDCADHRVAPDRGREGGSGWVPGRREARPGAGARLRRPRPAAGRPGSPSGRRSPSTG